ncbi:glycosyltransferase family 2 protein [Sphingomonas sp. DG1-23]|uniref:glycosyltransferase family 2 protein n=1 Tax=Sphingomonas sp. DG1-23 TaxID=3068316 RepID=UPI00273D3277|nr:glycosyltransferase family 2 protein [Sphingomonas sp. DG1-23]MDP5279851.1 glycosyltransferase family 2 protein [Sphingomonas sp. DG1-23]
MSIGPSSGESRRLSDGANPYRCWLDTRGAAIAAGDGAHWFACLTRETESLVGSAIARQAGREDENRLAVLVAPRPAPEVTARNDGPVQAFLASGPWVERFLSGSGLPPERGCYHALELALSGKAGNVHVDIVHDDALPVSCDPALRDVSVEVLIPHRGEDALLRICAEAIARQSHRCDVRLCFDQLADPAIVRELRAGAGAACFAVSPAPAGPYVIREHFGRTSNADFIAFQDSDDMSLPQRVSRLLDHAVGGDADMVGCHELRLDEIAGRVEAIRFPLDVNRALDQATGHAQFFPTTLLRTGFFRATGGFSTSRRYGADYQFLLRASRCGRIANLDAFLYVRRRRNGSLTTARGTSLRSPRRRLLNWRWKAAFAAVQAGRLELGQSSLRATRASREYVFTDLRTGIRESACL